MWQQLKAVIILPFTVTVIVPTIILHRNGLGGIAYRSSAPWNVLMLAGAALLVAIGLVLFVSTATLFVKVGRGTLAPWNPPQRLVLVGPYRHVRNPMISGVLFILLAEALFFGSFPLLYWFGVFLLLNAIVIPLAEEPGLQKRFGEDYARYKRNVPRWIPRLTPWQDTLQ
jgi:protein-S-isoprenylcysteine O-methyltransferase Ste14